MISGSPFSLISETSVARCACGNVKLCWKEGAPRFRIQCCCFDCRQKCAWAESKGGPALSHAVKGRTRPMDLVYFCNRFVVCSGEEFLRFYKLRSSSKSTNCVADCCFTTMMVDHTHYAGKCLLMFPEVVRLVTKLSPPSYVGFTKDWTETQLARLPDDPKLGPRPNTKGQTWSECNLAELPEPYDGSTTFKELLNKRLAALGEANPDVLGLKEGAEIMISY